MVKSRKSNNVRKHNDQKQNHRRSENTMVKRKITEGQKTQWPKDKSQKVRQHNGQKTNHRRSDNTMVKRQMTEAHTMIYNAPHRQHNDLHCTTQKKIELYY